MVRNALRAARGLGLLSIEERRLTAWRNAPNVVRIVSREWQAWLRLRAPTERARGGGCKFPKATTEGLIGRKLPGPRSTLSNHRSGAVMDTSG